jgi:hypothetical protein
MLLACPVSRAEGSGNLREAFERIETLNIANEGLRISDVSLRLGRLELRLDEGDLFPVLDRDGLVSGLTFEGRGRYRYTSADPTDRAVMTTRLERESQRLRFDGSTVEQRFERIVVLHAAMPYDNPWGDMATARAQGRTAELASGSTKLLAGLWRLLPTDGMGKIVQARSEGAPLHYLVAAIETRNGRVRYQLDGVHRQRESLSFFPARGSVNVGNQRVISVQPLPGADSSQISPAVSISSVHLGVRTDDNRTASIRSDLTLTVEREGVGLVAFGLGDGRPPTHWSWLPGRSSEGKLTRVTSGDGRALDFHHVNGRVLVDLGRRRHKGDRIDLRFETEDVSLAGLSGDSRLDYFELLTTDWYPRPVDDRADKFEFSIDVRTRKPYRPIAPGYRMEFSDLGEHYELRVVCPVPAPYVAVLAGRYFPVEEDSGDPTIRVYPYGSLDDKRVTIVANMARWFVSYFQEVLGEFPYPALEIVEAPERGGFGLAGPGVILISGEAFHPDPRAKYRNIGDWYKRLAHEIAHQWFGQHVTISSDREDWLYESLAEYLAGLAIRSLNYSENWRSLTFERLLYQWRSAASQVSVRRSGVVLAARQGMGQTRFGAPEALLYGRGPLIVRMLHGTVGDEAFVGILQELIARSEDGPLADGEFREIVEGISGRDMDWFFGSWLTSGEIPKVVVEYRLGPTESGKHLMFGTLRQPEGQEFRVVHVPFVVETIDGEILVETIVQDSELTTFHVLFEREPARVRVDPNRINLVRYSVRVPRALDGRRYDDAPFDADLAP